MREFFNQYPLGEKVIAAGVSGGADSLALVLRLKEWADAEGCRVVALTVDHRLRKESVEEAAYVGEVMARFGIEHHVLVWTDEKPENSIEEAAREARYRLLGEWCRKNGVKVFATGHHLRDQAETFLLRLIRGSGVDGLSGILPISERQGLVIIRPQLGDEPEMLREYLKKRGVDWVEDPSNENSDFLRVKVRKFLPVLEKELGLGMRRLADTCRVLGRTRGFVSREAGKILQHEVKSFDGGAAYAFSLGQWQKWHEEMRYRLLKQIIVSTGRRNYAPEAGEILRLMEVLPEKEFGGCTLGGCEILPFRKKIWIFPELKQAPLLPKKEWEAFVSGHPEYEGKVLPYKLRRFLWCRNIPNAEKQA